MAGCLTATRRRRRHGLPSPAAPFQKPSRIRPRNCLIPQRRNRPGLPFQKQVLLGGDGFALSHPSGALDAHIFTNDREKLGAALGHDVSHSSAHAPETKQEHAVTPQREIAPEQEQSLDIGLGL